jgi:ribosomal protein L11 methyltransferase
MKKTIPAPAPNLSVLTVEAEAGHADRLADDLSARFGKAAVQLQRPHANQVWIELYFDTGVEALLAARATAGLQGVLGTGTRLCQARDWQAFWRHHFHAHNVGARLRICPTWEAARDRAPGRVRLLLDPGLSFGTGEHFTTRFCLEMVDTLCQKSRPLSMLDVGTGSGILAMAAAKLGVRKVLGTDHDAQALEQARRNLALNRLSRRVKLAVMDITAGAPPGRFDLVCANIYAHVLIEVAPALARCARRHLVLSGIREHELDSVAETYLDLGLRETGRDGDGQWGGLVLECRTRSSSR